jgi:hypothetical protein
MNKRRAGRAAINLATVHILLHVIAVYFFGMSSLIDSDPSHLIKPAVFGLIASQFFLAAVWIAFSNNRFSEQISKAIVLSLAFFVPFTLFGGDYFNFSGLTFSCCVAIFIAMRLMGWKLLWMPRHGRLPPVQFFIKDIFFATTATAIFLSIYYCLPVEDRRDSGFQQVLGLTGLIVIVGIASLLSVLGMRHKGLRIMLIPFAFICGLIFFHLACKSALLFSWSVSASVFLILCLLISLGFLRRVGYRLIWRPECL